MFAIIMAGGSGKRFWPYSRKYLPKQFLNITGKDTMLGQTLTRLDGLVPPENRVIVINEEHEYLLKDYPSLEKSLILKEPFGRNTAPCVGLAALYLYLRNPDTPVAVIPADHYIPDTMTFQKNLKETIPLAKKGYIVTIGITPARPETGYGYIRRGISIEEESAYLVKRFVEKPVLSKAMEYLQSGEYFWNSGMFIFTPAVILEEISILLPDLYSKLEIIKETIDTEKYDSTLREIYKTINSVSIDYGIMEETKRPVAIIPAGFQWSDVGSWQSLFDLHSPQKDTDGNILEGLSLSFETKNSFIFNKTDKLVATLGTENLFLVNTDDVLLVGNFKDSQKVQDILEILKKKGLEKYL